MPNAATSFVEHEQDERLRTLVDHLLMILRNITADAGLPFSDKVALTGKAVEDFAARLKPIGAGSGAKAADVDAAQQVVDYADAIQLRVQRFLTDETLSVGQTVAIEETAITAQQSLEDLAKRLQPNAGKKSVPVASPAAPYLDLTRRKSPVKAAAVKALEQQGHAGPYAAMLAAGQVIHS